MTGTSVLCALKDGRHVFILSLALHFPLCDKQQHILKSDMAPLLFFFPSHWQPHSLSSLLMFIEANVTMSFFYAAPLMRFFQANLSKKKRVL